MIVRTTAYTLDLDKGTTEDRWDSPLTYGDKNADKIQATLMRGSAAATVSDLSAMLYGVRSDGTTAFRAATVVGNIVTAELDYPFYAIPGQLELLLQLIEGTEVTSTPLRITTYVKSGQTDELVNTGEQFSLAELQAIITECETATGNANDAAAVAGSAADDADAATEAANLAAGNAQDAADAITDITAEAGTLAPGSSATAFAEEDPEDGHINLVIGVPQGIQGKRGYLPWYGTAITGNSDVPTAYHTNLAMVNAQDIYIYTGIDSANAGNEYVCTLGGDEATALWKYLRNSRGIAGAGNVSFVDGASPDGEGNVALGAVRYTVAMEISDTDKAIARTNIGAVAVIGDSIPAQYDSMPAVTVEMLGQVAQYIGETGTYTFGSFYAAVSDGEPTPTYSWSEIVYGDPNSVSYDAQTGQTDAQKAQACNNIIAGRSNKNLFDNWDWSNTSYVINQRGLSGDITSGFVYDRWEQSAGTITIASGYLSIPAGAAIKQKIEGNALASVAVCVSVMIDGTVYSAIDTFPSSGENSPVTIPGFGTATLGYASGYMYVVLTAADSTRQVKKVKLERGAYSTLENDPPANCVEELAKCQRYAVPVGTSIRLRAYAVASDFIFFSYQLPATMRIQPTLSTEHPPTFEVRIVVNGSAQTGFTIGVSSWDGAIINFIATKTSHGLTDGVLAVTVRGMLTADL